ncbi:helix-turn-helix transcriptional regulator [Actinomadura sp. NPDC048032]|uniref:helix-turn-helix domain-containing protein n=1 Tax=Actinomadura sp. NPDC048032 TaxID=3155747 RepID=UPI00340BD403
MTSSPGPVVVRALLVAELRTLRHRQASGGDAAARELGWTPGRLARVENWTPRNPIDDLAALLDYRGAGPEQKEKLLRLAETARRPAWWEPYLTGWDDPEFARYLAYEAAALSISAVEVLHVPALLQTEGYARAVLGAYWPDATQERIDALVELRQRRRRLLDERDEQDVAQIYLLDEAVIRRRTGSAEVMLGQLDRLLQEADLPDVTIQVLPMAAAHTAFTGPFWLLDTGEGIDDVLHLERFPRSSTYIGASPELAEHRVAFARLSDDALSPDRSRELLETVRAELADGD